MHFVLLSTNFLESVIDSKIEYLILLSDVIFSNTAISTDFRNRAGFFLQIYILYPCIHVVTINHSPPSAGRLRSVSTRAAGGAPRRA